MRLTLKGAQQYWFHPALITVLRERTGWDEKKSREFISKSDLIHFNGIHQKTAMAVLEKLQAEGFQIQLDSVDGTYVATLALGQQEELAAVKKQMADLNQRIANLETGLASSSVSGTLQSSPAYHLLSQEAASAGAARESSAPEQAPNRQVLQQGTSESNIGRFWLSRIGVVSLVLGVVFLIGYSMQYINAYGKIALGLLVGAGMILVGNAVASREKDRQWAMGIIGGGWAISYFTVFAAYQLPVTRIIHNPMVAMFFLMAVALGAIVQALSFNSAILVGFSYILAYTALTTAPAGFYTLVASFILACSLIVVLKKKQWSVLSLIAFTAVYLIHFIWLEPGIYALPANSGSRLFDVFTLPWMGEAWKISPIITAQQSLLHQGFLILYWLLFTVLGFLKSLRTKDDEILVFAVLAGNSFLFTGLYLDHLHVYYPAIKYFFPLVMSAVFGGLFYLEGKQGRALFSDLYLTFAVSLLCLTIPMCFDGPILTYGWSAATVALVWLGLKNSRKVLHIIGLALAAIVLFRLLFLDYAQQEEMFRLILPVRECFFIYMAGSLAFFLTHLIYKKTRALSEPFRNRLQTIFLSASMMIFGAGVLIGGPRAAASFIWVAAAIPLMIVGLRSGNRIERILSLIFLFFAALRLCSVDFSQELNEFFSDSRTAARLTAAAVSVLAILRLADWIRRKAGGVTAELLKASNIMSAVGSFLVLFYFYDGSLGSWITIIWGVTGFAFLTAGFGLKDKTYRWCGLGIFGIVVLRLFLHDFSHLETIYRIISFIALGGVLIAASVLYNKYSRVFLADEGK